MKIALITGASTGIGLATAEKFLVEGCFVVLTARSTSLSRFDKVGFLKDPSRYWIRALDVTNPVERRELIDEIGKKLGRLDILVNNAGVIYRTPLEYAYEFESVDQMLVNFHAPLELIKVCLPIMRRQGGGHIINISSAAGFFAVPTMGLYAASKQALEGASEALYHELRPSNIHVTIVQPGFVSSEEFDHPRLGLVVERLKKDAVQTHASQSGAVSALIAGALKLTSATPQIVASHIWRVIQMQRPPLRHNVTLDTQVFGALRKFLPDRVIEKLASISLNNVGEKRRALLPHGPMA